MRYWPCVCSYPDPQMTLVTTIRRALPHHTDEHSSVRSSRRRCNRSMRFAQPRSSYVKEHVPSKARGDVAVTVGALDSRLRLAACSAPLKVSLPTGATYRARMTLAVSCAASTTWTVFVPVSVETKSTVLVLKHAAGRGARITEQDVEVQTRMVSGSGDDYLTDIAELSGRTLKRPTGRGGGAYSGRDGCRFPGEARAAGDAAGGRRGYGGPGEGRRDERCAGLGPCKGPEPVLRSDRRGGRRDRRRDSNHTLK